MNLGTPELLVILGTLLFSALPVVVTAIVVWMIAKRQIRPSTMATSQCTQCGQRIPDLGSFCPLCGKRLS
jgi:hypothetical protein